MLMKAGYQPVIIEAKDRPVYYESLNDYAAAGNLENFYNLVLDKERFILEDLKSEIDKVKNRGKSR